MLALSTMPLPSAGRYRPVLDSCHCCPTTAPCAVSCGSSEEQLADSAHVIMPGTVRGKMRNPSAWSHLSLHSRLVAERNSPTVSVIQSVECSKNIVQALVRDVSMDVLQIHAYCNLILNSTRVESCTFTWCVGVLHCKRHATHTCYMCAPVLKQ